MASIADILRTIQTTITAGINAAGIQTPGQVVVGWPTGSEAAKIWGNGDYLVTLYALRTQPATRYRPSPYLISQLTPPTLVATITPQVGGSLITFSGANQPGLNITTVYGPQNAAQVALYRTTGAETLAQLATFVSAGITGSPLVTATPSGATILVSGGFLVKCNVGATSTLAQEVARFKRQVQVTIWSPTPDAVNAPSDGTREQVEAAVIASIGGTDQPWNYAPDGTAFSALWRSTGDWSDDAESSYTVFKSDNFLEIDYALIKPVTATQIGAVTLNKQQTTSTGFSTNSTNEIGG